MKQKMAWFRYPFDNGHQFYPVPRAAVNRPAAPHHV
jgi:hypothetical protein